MILQKCNGQLCRMLAVLLNCIVSYVVSMPHGQLIHRYNVSSGDTVTIPCSHTGPFSSPADWVRPRSGQVPEKEICLGVVCQNGFALRFSVDAKKNYQLTIQNVTAKDTGKCVCIAYDDYTSHRYTNELIVTDRSYKDGDDTITTTTVGDYSSNAETQTDLSDVAVVVIIAAVIVATCLVIGVISIAVFRRRVHARDESVSDLTQLDAKLFDFLDTEDDNRPRQTEQKPEKVSTFEDMALDRDAYVLALTFVKLFRAFYDGSNENVSAAKSYKILASSTSVWWVKLRGNGAAKRRIRRQIYYSLSGYDVCPRRLDPVQPAPTISPVMSVAVMNGRVYTICKESDTIIVDSNRKGSIRVKEMKFPVDIAAYAPSEVLYIADEQRCIWRVPLGGATTKWQAFRERIPKTLSINCHGSLLVTTDSNVILKFMGDGSGGKVINLEEHTEVHHAVETIHHTAVICYTLGTRAGVVAEVGFDGQKIRAFTCVPQLIRTPSYLALDRDGRILVADPGNSRILLLDSKLKHSYTIIDHRRHGIGAPQRLCLDETTGKLLVADWPNHSVQAFNIKTPLSRSTTKLQKLFRINV